jgi:hypothetical protein
MRHITIALTILGVFSVVSFSISAKAQPRNAQSKEEKIARAMEAAPASISGKAAIVEADGTVLRQGSNGWTCLPNMGPGSSYPACNDTVWMHLMQAWSKHAEFKTDRVGISYMLAGDDNVNNADPFDMKEDPGEVWVQEGPHLMIIVPDSKSLEGLSANPNNGGPYVMWKGTPYAHIMVPIGPRQGKQ